MEGRQILDVSWETILKIALAGLLFYLLFLVRDIVIAFFFGFIISILLEPAIRILKWLKIPRIVAAALIYLFIFGFLGLLIYLSVPIFANEIKEFSRSLPQYFNNISPIFSNLGIEALQSIESLTQTIVDTLEKFSGSIFNALVSFFGGLASTLFILAIAFFLSLEENGMRDVLSLIVPKKYEEFVIALFERCEEKVSGWFGARILVCFFVGIASFAVLYLFHVQYAFILSLLAGVLNFIPFLGPLITGALFVLFIGISSGWLKALIILAAFILIQEFENNILSPLLMKKFVGLPPVLVLLSLVIGGIIFGFLGVIFAVPVFGILYEFIKEFLEKRKEEEMQAI